MTYRATTIEQILNGFKTISITYGQIDLNGLCNAKCWYCPVKYEGNPQEFVTNTSVSDLETMLSNIRSSQSLCQNFEHIYTCHYNEILLYPYFEDMLKLFRKYKFKTLLLSNGTPLTKSKLDLILEYPDVISGICLNVPDIDKEQWAKKAGFSESVYATLIRNLTYINEKYPHATIQVNTSIIDVKEKGILNTDADNEKIVNSFKTLFPNLGVSVLRVLSDRASRLTEHNVVFSNQRAVFTNEFSVSGCTHSSNEGGRLYSWFHINAKGDMFICCDDYDMKYKFGNILTNSFDSVWNSTNHAEVIRKAQSEMCIKCASAV